MLKYVLMVGMEDEKRNRVKKVVSLLSKRLCSEVCISFIAWQSNGFEEGCDIVKSITLLNISDGSM